MIFSILFQAPNRDYRNEFKKCLKKILSFIVYYNKSKIFYNKEIRNIVDEIILEMKDAWIKYTLDPPVGFENKNSESNQENYKRWNEAWEFIDFKFKMLKEKLENEFNGILNP